jgi:hypothetical protein
MGVPLNQLSLDGTEGVPTLVDGQHDRKRHHLGILPLLVLNLRPRLPPAAVSSGPPGSAIPIRDA